MHTNILEALILWRWAVCSSPLSWQYYLFIIL